MNLDETVKFMIPSSQRNVERTVPDLLDAIATALTETVIQYEGKEFKLHVLTPSFLEDKQQWNLMFDVRDPNECFDHIEFSIRQTGWGRVV